MRPKAVVIVWSEHTAEACCFACRLLFQWVKLVGILKQCAGSTCGHLVAHLSMNKFLDDDNALQHTINSKSNYLTSNQKPVIRIRISAHRMTISHNPLGSSSTLNVKMAQVTDEDTYVCETTFLEPMESCGNTGSFSIGLQVHGYNKFLHVLFVLRPHLHDSHTHTHTQHKPIELK